MQSCQKFFFGFVSRPYILRVWTQGKVFSGGIWLVQTFSSTSRSGKNSTGCEYLLCDPKENFSWKLPNADSAITSHSYLGQYTGQYKHTILACRCKMLVGIPATFHDSAQQEKLPYCDYICYCHEEKVGCNITFFQDVRSKTQALTFRGASGECSSLQFIEETNSESGDYTFFPLKSPRINPKII